MASYGVGIFAWPKRHHRGNFFRSTGPGPGLGKMALTLIGSGLFFNAIENESHLNRFEQLLLSVDSRKRLDLDMLANYFKIAWRSITRHKGYAAINLFGLALGMTGCLFILLWVRDEKSIDNFHSGGDNLFTLYERQTANGKTGGDYNTPVRSLQGSRYPNFLLDGAKDAIP